MINTRKVSCDVCMAVGPFFHCLISYNVLKNMLVNSSLSSYYDICCVSLFIKTKRGIVTVWQILKVNTVNGKI